MTEHHWGNNEIIYAFLIALLKRQPQNAREILGAIIIVVKSQGRLSQMEFNIKKNIDIQDTYTYQKLLNEKGNQKSA